MNKIKTFLLILSLLAFPFLGNECDKILETTGGDITGNWVLVYIGGTQHDICPGEVVTFPNAANGYATLQCPYQPQITEAYLVSGGVLKYTRTGVEYYIRTLNQTELVLEGKSPGNVQYRQLTYNRTATIDSEIKENQLKLNNSSE